jgi:alkanesulfonate monooxygenase SsuD/methylene tetrahydromethanopterin reductase-like flavin-dependent oxidoreductase (luciferase family)
MLQFGWRVPDFPVDGSDTLAFRDQIFSYMDALQGGLDSAWVADHFVPWMGSWDQTADTFECLTTLTYLCARYPAFKFGTIVLSQSYRPPALLAKMATVLQTLSGGRFILGIGAGWKEDEYRAYGYDYPAPAVRIHQLEEAVQIIRGMFTQPKTTFHGKYYHVEDVICEPKPFPPPPIMIGGSGRKLTLRVVARYADWWNSVGTSPEEMNAAIEALNGHCQAVGRDPASIVRTFSTDCVSVAGSTAEALRRAQASPFYSASAGLIGTPDEVAAGLQRYIDLGTQHFMLRFVDYPDFAGARLFIEEVLPRFRA